LKSTVTDPAISRNLASYWEKKFFQDMARLRVRDPDIITRVTEYVPEIVSFVEKIILNGYAYEAEGSVYFNTAAFDKAEGHHYAKLEPWSKGNRELLEGGEGSSLRNLIDSLSRLDLLRFFGHSERKTFTI
jgi:cysteinyl-tRNA synthetase